jgi:hypothetical protein
MGLPNIDIEFKKAASTLITRSERGVAGLIIRDTTDASNTISYTYTALKDIDATKFTAANAQYIEDCFVGNPNRVIVVRIKDEDETLADLLTNSIWQMKHFDYICMPEATTEETTILVAWAKAQTKTVKAVVFSAAASNSQYVINFVNTKVTFTDNRGEVDGKEYLPTLCGIFAGIGLDKSATYYICSNLVSVIEPTSIDSAIDAGGLVLINDGEDAEGNNIVRVGRAINSLTTIADNQTSDFKKIAIIEALDLIRNDISTVFKNNYVGQYKNNLSNQMIFISAINTYFQTLVDEKVLDLNYANVSDIDIVSQRAALIASGKDATNWTDVQVRNATVADNIYVTADIKVLDAIENLSMGITLN